MSSMSPNILSVDSVTMESKIKTRSHAERWCDKASSNPPSTNLSIVQTITERKVYDKFVENQSTMSTAIFHLNIHSFARHAQDVS